MLGGGVVVVVVEDAESSNLEFHWGAKCGRLVLRNGRFSVALRQR